MSELSPDAIRQVAKALDAQNVPDHKRIIPEIWSDHIIDAFKNAMRYIKRVLDPNDVWAPTGENYQEAIAWARLCGVTIYTSDIPSTNHGKSLFLHKPGCITTELELCPPNVLINAIRDYVSNAKAPQVDDE